MERPPANFAKVVYSRIFWSALVGTLPMAADDDKVQL